MKTADAKEPLPYLLICAFIANAASFVLPISNPANLVIYGSHMPPLLQWLPRYGLPSVLSIVATYLVLRGTQAGQLKQEVSAEIDVIIAGALQAWGPPMNGALRKSLENPWLASTVSFLPIVAFLLVLWLCLPNPMPSLKGIAAMPWWAPLGGLVGSFAVIMGLLFVDKIGAGPFAGLTITANILMSLVIDHFGLFGIAQHSLNIWRILGSALVTGGIVLIALF